MGTRSLTRIFDGDKEILCIYRQMDGYPSGHGAELAAFVSSRPFVNGIGESSKVFNGMGCFAAQLVASLKGDSAGGIYISAPGTDGCGEEFVYEIHGGLDRAAGMTPIPVTIKAFSVYDSKSIYEGDVTGFVAFCNESESA